VSESQRIDKWLWHARVVKTRTLAAGLVTAGHLRLNRARISKPSHTVRPGDVITVALDSRVVVLRIEAVAARRGPASEAAMLYTDLSPPPPPKPDLSTRISRDPGTGRPTKRERRRLEAWKGDLKAPDEEEI
jgi:ribosome-associated heat shock protein Hsp15